MLKNDEEMMRRVLDLAEQGIASTQPNPRVACIIVKDGHIVGQGVHMQAGELHAERLALAEAGDNARGATAYINLEPCCHQGRTPPCTDGLIDAGVVKVVSAMSDPNPLVRGVGHELLRNAGVEVVSGVLEHEARWLNRGFISRMVTNRPLVKLKSAATLDGRTAAYDGSSKWITGEKARAEVQTIRSQCCAIITGIGTVLADDPAMNVRLKPAAEQQYVRQPMRVVLDSELKTPIDSKIIGDDQKLVIFTLSDDVNKTASLIEKGVEVIKLPGAQNEQLVLGDVLDELARWECNEVLVEAGQTLSGAFLEQGLVDELILFYAGSILGEQGKSMFKFKQAIEFEKRSEFFINSVKMMGKDIRVDAIKPRD